MHQIRQLRILSTLLLAFAVAQAGLGSGSLDVRGPLLVAHATNAFAVAVLAVLAVVFGWGTRRAGLPAWTFYLPLVVTIGVAVQMSLGFAGVRGGHVFFGVLLLCTITAYCSYAWRLQPSAAAGARAGGATSTRA